MKHLKYITWMLLVVLCAACEQMQLPDTDVIIEREKATDLTANSAAIEVEFYPTDATIKTVEVYYTEGLHYSKLMHKEMLRVSGLTYRAELTNLNSNTKYQVYYLLKNAFSTLEVNDDFSFRTAKNNKPSNVIDTVYHIDFRQTIGAWTVRNYLLPEGMGYVWQKTDQYGMKASAFFEGANHASEAWLISSPLNLTSNTTAYLTFDQTYKYGDVSQLSVKITKNGLDWTTLEVPTWPDGTSWDFINSGEIDITKYISANTQIAYAYTSSTDGAPTWEIRNVLIKGNGTRLEEPATSVTVPTVVTSAVTQIAETTAVAGGNVKSDGGASVTGRGVVYSTSANPTTANSKVASGSGTGAFVCNLTDLQPNTTYYIRAYAKNDFGIAYGDEVSFTTKEEVIATPEYVDLGLSVKWATFNVGATKPEEYGDYFAWGETEPKEVYDWSTYKWCNGSSTTLTKYCTSSRYGTVDNKKTLELSDDAAYANWGGEWRIPTDADFYELHNKCTWTWTTQNGVNGYKVTGTNGNSIFLPAAGYRVGSSLYNAGSNGPYWSSSLRTSASCYGEYWSFDSDGVYTGNDYRFYGQSIRPVYGSQVEQAMETITVNGVSFNMIRVQSGTFTMGATSEQGSDVYSDESPTHTVILYNFSIGETEVTQELWQAVMGSNPSYFSGTNLPVEKVSWNDCQTFITKLNELTGKTFRLPTEAEWEYAARGGNKSKGYKYAGSDSLSDVAWYTDNSSSKPHPVKQKQANELGLYDMSGNVGEWCQDRYGSYGSGTYQNPKGPTSGSYRVGRGGGWSNNSRDCRVSKRGNGTPTSTYYNLGLRLAL